MINPIYTYHFVRVTEFGNTTEVGFMYIDHVILFCKTYAKANPKVEWKIMRDVHEVISSKEYQSS